MLRYDKMLMNSFMYVYQATREWVYSVLHYEPGRKRELQAAQSGVEAGHSKVSLRYVSAFSTDGAEDDNDTTLSQT